MSDFAKSTVWAPEHRKIPGDTFHIVPLSTDWLGNVGQLGKFTNITNCSWGAISRQRLVAMFDEQWITMMCGIVWMLWNRMESLQGVQCLCLSYPSDFFLTLLVWLHSVKGATHIYTRNMRLSWTLVQRFWATGQQVCNSQMSPLK